jgi:hypothetical protein
VRPRELGDALEQPAVEGLGVQLVDELLRVCRGHRVVGRAHRRVTGLRAGGQDRFAVDRLRGIHLDGGDRPEQVHPPVIVLARLAGQLRHQWLLVAGHPGQAGLDLGPVREKVQPLGAGLQLAGRLGPPQQQHGDQRPFVVAQAQVLVEQLVILQGAGAGIAVDHPHQLPQPQPLQPVEHVGVGIVDDRVAAAALIARGAQAVEGHRIAAGDGALLLQQGAEDALLPRVELGQRARVGLVCHAAESYARTDLAGPMPCWPTGTKRPADPSSAGMPRAIPVLASHCACIPRPHRRPRGGKASERAP